MLCRPNGCTPRETSQRDTLVADVRGMVKIIMFPGHHATRVSLHAAELLVQCLGGDLRIIDEVCAVRDLQEQLALAQESERKSNCDPYTKPRSTNHVARKPNFNHLGQQTCQQTSRSAKPIREQRTRSKASAEEIQKTNIFKPKTKSVEHTNRKNN